MHTDDQRADEQLADVTLLLEGTYPYVRGGVSSWVHELITGLPELRFALVFLGAQKPPAEEQPQYAVPQNVGALHRYYLMEANAVVPKSCPGEAKYFQANDALHEWFRDPGTGIDGQLFDATVLQRGRSAATCEREFFHSQAAWSQIVHEYARRCPEMPFLSYFWAVRNTHGPLLKLVDIARAVPKSKTYHAVSTGYAGLLGAMLARMHQRPLILTEHGIYAKERKIELLSLFLKESQGWQDTAPPTGLEHHEQLWLRLFEGLSRMTYGAASPIISLYEQNRQRQILDGADPGRTRIVPNGVDIARYAPLRDKRAPGVPRVLGLIGRIVPIKDIKTFIRAIHALSRLMPDVQGWLIGPEEEDPAYVAECRELVRTLQLENHIRFLGFQRIDDILPQLGLMVLTSISEAFPLVIGESFASGLPVLTTDVGACRDLVEGREPEDRALGSGGAVVPISDPDALASAAFELLGDEERWREAQGAGIARVERYYRQSGVIEAYRDIYHQAGSI
jgi:glycosyltransferase involved in cell wall biosynthesis